MTWYLVLIAVLAFVTGALFKMGALFDSGVIRMYAWFGVMAVGLAGTGALMRWQWLSGLRTLDRVLAGLPSGFTQLEFGRQAWDLWRQTALNGGPAPSPNFEPPPGCGADDDEESGPCSDCPAANAAERAASSDGGDDTNAAPGWPPGWTRERLLGVRTPPPQAVIVSPGGIAVIYTEDLPNHWRGKRANDRLEVAANKALLAGTLLGTIVERLFPYRPDCRPIGIFPIVVLTRRKAPEGDGSEAVTFLNPEQLPERLAALGNAEVMHEREREHLVAVLAGTDNAA